jgi:hypothetical protein
MPGSRAIGWQRSGRAQRRPRPRPTAEEIASQEDADALAAFNRGESVVRFAPAKLSAQSIVDGLAAAAEEAAN